MARIGKQYRMDLSGMDQIGSSAAMSAASLAAAQQVKAHLVARTPKDTGALASSFEVYPQTVAGGRTGEARAGAVVVNHAPYAPYVRPGGRHFMTGGLPAAAAALGRRGRMG